MDGEGRGGLRLLREKGEEVFLEDGGWVGQGLFGLPQLKKKSCSAGGAEELETEAGPSKKRRVEGKGKGKAVTLTFGVAESVAVDVLWDILKELKGLRAEVGDLRAFAQCTTSIVESGWRIQQQIGLCINEMHHHFMPNDDDEGSVRVGAGNEGIGRVGAKDKEDGRDRAESEGTCDVEMEENGADMVDNTMDETLH